MQIQPWIKKRPFRVNYILRGMGWASHVRASKWVVRTRSEANCAVSVIRTNLVDWLTGGSIVWLDDCVDSIFRLFSLLNSHAEHDFLCRYAVPHRTFILAVRFASESELRDRSNAVYEFKTPKLEGSGCIYLSNYHSVYHLSTYWSIHLPVLRATRLAVHPFGYNPVKLH